MKKQIYVLVLFIFIILIPNKITPQSTEENWSSNFYTYNEQASLLDISITNDNKILIIGNSNNNMSTFGIFYNLDGTFTSSQTENSIIDIESESGVVNYSTTDLQGRIYLAGESENSSWITRNKLNNEQSESIFFEKELSIKSGIEIKGIKVDKENNIIVIGSFVDLAGITKSVIVKYDSTGNIDNSFGDNGKIELEGVENISAFFLGNDGSIFVSHKFVSSNSSEYYQYSILKYENSGTLDTTFGEQGRIDDIVIGGYRNRITNLIIDSDDNIIALGYYKTPSSMYHRHGVILAKYNSSGNKYYAKVIYQADNIGTGTIPSCISVNSNNEMMISLYKPPYNHWSQNLLYHLSSNGEVNDTINLPFITSDNIIKKMIYNDDGTVLIGGTTPFKIGGKYPYNDASIITLYRLQKNGSFDNRFGKNGKVYSSLSKNIITPYIQDISIDSENNIYLLRNKSVFKMTSEGIPDSSFNYDGLLSYPYMFDERSLVVNSNDNIILGGAARAGFNDRSISVLVGIDNVGYIDRTFGGEKNISYSYYKSGKAVDFNDITLDEKGNIYTLVGEGGCGVSKFSPLGENIFNTSVYKRHSYPTTLNSIALDSGGKILFCGKYNSKLTVYRLNNVGSIDSTFNGIGHSEFFEGEGYTIKCDKDNRPLASGIYNSHIVITRFNYNGTVDTTFGKKGIVETPLLQPFFPKKPSKKNFVIDKYGRIIVIGSMQKNDDYVMSLARYNEDGTLDETFGDNGVLKSNRYTKFGELIALDNDENIIAVGISDNKIIIKKYKNSYVVSIKSNDNNVPKDYSLSQNYPNPFNPTTTIKYSIPTDLTSSTLGKGRTEEGFVTLKLYDVLGKEVATLVNEKKASGNYEVTFDGSNLTSGIYFYSLTSGDFRQTKKLILLK